MNNLKVTSEELLSASNTMTTESIFPTPINIRETLNIMNLKNVHNPKQQF